MTLQDSYVSAFVGHYLLWFAFFASFYSSDGQTKMSSSICVAILHTPFLILIISAISMIGLVLAVTPASFAQQLPTSTSCDHPVNFAMRTVWPDQVLINYVIEWWVEVGTLASTMLCHNTNQCPCAAFFEKNGCHLCFLHISIFMFLWYSWWSRAKEARGNWGYNEAGTSNNAPTYLLSYCSFSAFLGLEIITGWQDFQASFWPPWLLKAYH